MVTITTTGSGEVRRLAERATLTAYVSVASEDRDASIDGATTLHNELVARAVRLRDAGAATWHEASSPSTSVNRWDEQSGRRTEHVTTSSVRVRVCELSLVAELVDEFGRAGASVGVDWSLTDATRRELARSMRTTAIADARGRAADYAEALGMSVRQVVAVREDDHGPIGPMMRAAMSTMDAGRADVTVPEIPVTVSVTGEFLAE